MATVIRRFVAMFSTKADTKGVQKFEKGMDRMKGAVAAAAGAIASLGAALGATALGAEAEEAKNLAAAFKELGGSQQQLKDLRRLTKGLIPDKELTKMANLSALFGISNEQVAGLAEVAVGASVATGESVEKMFGDILTASSRQSVLIADNLGILVRKSEAYEKQAIKQGKTVAALTDEEKSLAFINALLDGGTRQRAVAQKLAGSEVANTKVQIANLKTEFALLLSGPLKRLFAFVGGRIIPLLRSFVAELKAIDFNSAKVRRAMLVLKRAAAILAAGFAILLGAKIVAGFGFLLGAVKALIIGFKALKVQALLAQGAIAAIPLLIVAMILLIEDFFVFLRGGDSLIGRFVERFAEADGPLGDLARGLIAVKPLVNSLLDDAGGFVPLLKDIGAAGFAAFKEFIAPAIEFVIGLIKMIVTRVIPDMIAATAELRASVARVFTRLAGIVKRFVAVAIRLFVAQQRIVIALAKAAVRIIGKILAKILPIIINLMSRVLSKVEANLPAIEKFIDGVATFVEGMLDGLIKAIDFFIAEILPIIEGAIKVITDILIAIMPTVLEITGGIFGAVNDIAAFLSKHKDAFVAAWNATVAVVEGTKAVFEAIAEFITNLFEPVLELVAEATGLSDAFNISSLPGFGGDGERQGGLGSGVNFFDEFDAAEASASAAGLGGGASNTNVNAPLSVGGVTVNIQGSPNDKLGASDIAGAAEKGVTSAASLRETQRDFASG